MTTTPDNREEFYNNPLTDAQSRYGAPPRRSSGFGRSEYLTVPYMRDRRGNLFSTSAVGPGQRHDDRSFESVGYLRMSLDKLVEMTHKQMAYLWEQHVTSAAILVGRDMFRGLLIGFEDDQRWLGVRPLEFNIPAEYQPQVYPESFAAKFLGLPVHVLDWMEGFVIVPDVWQKPRKGSGFGSWELWYPEGYVRAEECLAELLDETIKGLRDHPEEAKDALGVLRRFFGRWLNEDRAVSFVKPVPWWRRFGSWLDKQRGVDKVDRTGKWGV